MVVFLVLACMIRMDLGASVPETSSKPITLPPHPRLRFNDSDIERLRKLIGNGPAADSMAKKLYANVSSHVDYLLAQPLPDNGSGLVCDTIRDHIYAYGLMYRMSSDKQRKKALADRSAREMLLVAAMGNWTWRFLSVAETTHALSIGYDWFYHDLTPSQRAGIEDGIARLGLERGRQCYLYNCTWIPGIPGVGNCTNCWWIRAPMNWNVVSNGGMAIGALAIGDVPRYADIARTVLSHALGNVPPAIAQYSNDGAWPEGPGYWCYITKYLLATADTLIYALGHDHGIMSTPGVDKTAHYALQMHHNPSLKAFNYGDAEEADGDIDYQNRYAANLLGLQWHFGHAVGFAPGVAARQALQPPPITEASSWDEIVLSLLRWSRDGSMDDIAALPTTAFYLDKGAAIWWPGLK